MDRKTDEETIMFYLQKFSEDSFMGTFIPRLSDEELEEMIVISGHYNNTVVSVQTAKKDAISGCFTWI